MTSVPRASSIRTPAQAGVTAPPGDGWPLNRGRWTEYALNTIYPTVQGEGQLTGTAMTIIRLQGCPVGCVFCDTPESWVPPSDWRSVFHEGQPFPGTRGGGVGWAQARAIAAYVASLPPRWALITGGEPAWYDLGALTAELRALGLSSALETSGVYAISGLWQWVCVSPKPAGLLPLCVTNLTRADEVKWIVGKAADLGALEAFLAAHAGTLNPAAVVSVQPMSASPKATALCVDALMAHPTWQLSLQTHKYLQIA